MSRLHPRGEGLPWRVMLGNHAGKVFAGENSRLQGGNKLGVERTSGVARAYRERTRRRPAVKRGAPPSLGMEALKDHQLFATL